MSWVLLPNAAAEKHLLPELPPALAVQSGLGGLGRAHRAAAGTAGSSRHSWQSCGCSFVRRAGQEPARGSIIQSESESLLQLGTGEMLMKYLKSELFSSELGRGSLM